MADPALPETYNKLPDPLKPTLVKSHQEYVKGWKGRSFVDYVNDLDSGGHLAVIRDVYTRCTKEPKLWPFIQVIIGPWTYAAGHNISQGFNFLCDKPDELLKALRGSSFFCEDDPTTTVHGPRDCFRELITSGAGLHVCVVRPASRQEHHHDIHIDKFQTVCARKADGSCDYKKLNTNFVYHMKDVVPWFLTEVAPKKIEEAAKAVGKVAGEALRDYGERESKGHGPKW
ncbi:MAG: hypothetical protein P9F75_02585 [Candidatus Contendobacter sp.]|nr:hypothetical protein [Candidatus Contendobacter sp.]